MGTEKAEKPPTLEREPLPDPRNVRLDLAQPFHSKDALAKCLDNEATALMSTAGRDSSKDWKIHNLWDPNKLIPPIKLLSVFQDAGPTSRKPRQSPDDDSADDINFASIAFSEHDGSKEFKHSTDLALWLYRKARDNPDVLG